MGLRLPDLASTAAPQKPPKPLNLNPKAVHALLQRTSCRTVSAARKLPVGFGGPAVWSWDRSSASCLAASL